MDARLSDYDYDLPAELIAQRPLPRREDARMMVLRRDAQTIEHRQFVELRTLLSPGDLLVLNDTRVVPARKFSDDGAIAAPTAGLHFTREILDDIPHAFVTLHIGTGTFRPVRSENISEHCMHAERFSILPAAAQKIDHAKRVLAVGTTTVRVLESARRQDGKLVAQTGSTDIFIYPPFEFRVVDLLLTNFHLPRSTLLMLVSAFAGREFLLRAYEEAIHQRYRFYSYGDCMLIL